MCVCVEARCKAADAKEESVEIRNPGKALTFQLNCQSFRLRWPHIHICSWYLRSLISLRPLNLCREQFTGKSWTTLVTFSIGLETAKRQTAQGTLRVGATKTPSGTQQHDDAPGSLKDPYGLSDTIVPKTAHHDTIMTAAAVVFQGWTSQSALRTSPKAEFGREFTLPLSPDLALIRSSTLHKPAALI